jgi:purine nucleoside permease
VDRVLSDYSMLVVNRVASTIKRLSIQANNFEIKPMIIQMIQQTVRFKGLSQEHPNVHIIIFLETCNFFKHNEVTNDTIYLRLFLFYT